MDYKEKGKLAGPHFRSEVTCQGGLSYPTLGQVRLPGSFLQDSTFLYTH